MTERKHPELYQTLDVLCQHQGLVPADVARALHMQPGSFKRSMESNPTLKLMKRVGWALGTRWMWLGLEPEEAKQWVQTTIRFDPESPAVRARATLEVKSQKPRRSRKPDAVDPLDKEALAQQYPAQALQSDLVVNTDYLPVEDDLPPKDVVPTAWEQKRRQLGVGLPEHLCMTDKAIEAGHTYQQYIDRGWSLQALSHEGLICDVHQKGE